MKVKVDIISGFLGAGKTTLIKKLLEEKLQNEKLVIIENEFGEIGIDGPLLNKTGIKIKEITSGCICCTLEGDFVKALEEVITKYKPDRIMIEPSGVGKLSDVIMACNHFKLKDILEVNILIAVVDVMRYQLFVSNFGGFFKNQIENAKTIILSRTQKVDSKKLVSIVRSIQELNGRANIITTPWEKLKADQIIAIAEKDLDASLENQLSIPKVSLEKHQHDDNCECGHKHNHQHNEHCTCSSEEMHDHSAEEVFDVWGIETPKVFDEMNLRNIIDQLASDYTFGLVLRGKGILQVSQDKWVQFDYVPGEVQIKSINADYTGRICIIGSNLNKSELVRLFGLT